MTSKELKKEYLALLKEELARAEITKANLFEKMKDKESRYFSGEYDSICRRILALKHDILSVQEELENNYSLDIEEFENIDSFRNWKKRNPNTKIKNIYPAKRVIGGEGKHLKQIRSLVEEGLEKIVKNTLDWSETFIYVIYWKKRGKK